MAKARRRKAGVVESTRFQSDKGLPKSNATASELAAYQQAHKCTGGFDPCSITRKPGT